MIEGVTEGRRRRIGRRREPTFHDKVEAFYRRYVPREKWKNVDVVSEMYEGREDELNEGLRKKYQADLDDVVVVFPKEDTSLYDDDSNDEIENQVDDEMENEIENEDSNDEIENQGDDEMENEIENEIKISDTDEDSTTIQQDDLDQNEDVDVFGHPIPKPKPKKKKKKVKPQPSTNNETPRFRQQHQQKSSKSSLMKVIIIITVTTSLGGCVGILAIVFRSRLTRVFEVLKDAVQQATSKAFRQDDEETIRSSRKRHRKKKKRQYVVESSSSDEDENDETTQLLDEETRIVNEEMSSELVKFLNSIGVRPKSVAKKLYEAGFERWDTFRYVSESDLVQFGFRRGRVLLIKQRLKRLMKDDVSKPIEMRPMMASSVLKNSVERKKRKRKTNKKEEQEKDFPAAAASSSDSSEGQHDEFSYREEEDKVDQDDSDDEKVSFSSDEDDNDDDDEEDEFDKVSKEWNKMKPSTTLKREVNERQRRVDVDWSEDGQVYETPTQTGALAQTQASEQKRSGMFEKFKKSRINKTKKTT